MPNDTIIYLVIATAYGYAALKSFEKGEYYHGCKDVISAFLYACIAIALFDLCSTHPCTVAA